MEIEAVAWISLLVFCMYFASSAANIRNEESHEVLKFADCQNYARNKSALSAPVFSVVDGENLSFKECGLWNRSADNPISPWIVYLRDDGSIKNAGHAYGVILSDQTILTVELKKMYRAFKDGNKISIFGGKCFDAEKCFEGRGLLRQKGLEITKTEFQQENVCFRDRLIKSRECDMYTNSICTSKNQGYPQYLLIHRGFRFYLRGLDALVGIETLAWLDLLPFTKRIVLATKDLAVMPETPELKRKIDFGESQSFRDCGFKESHLRATRESEKSSRSAHVGNGRNAVRGQHPWHASLSTFDGFDNFCGATLISKTTLVTAAHCLFMNDGSMIKSSQLKIVLGIHNAEELAENYRQNFMVSKLLVHPDYSQTKKDYQNDIALIILVSEVLVNYYMRPICLWNFGYELSRIANKTGTLVGLGYTTETDYPGILQEAQLKVVSNEDCYESSRSFFSYNLRPTKNFCAGFPENHTGACNGDSGGGFVLEVRDRIFLRGVVNMGRLREAIDSDGAVTIKCNLAYYSLFTDVTYFMEWIVKNTPDLRASFL
ncbi:coagulation factor VII-like isoform X2 [Neocloeon triangulifer]|uniref:coagulation factor VII-like isoform X2 n=1 Tax=Neocloeon triangulifer TaxID=2078957 RepID=UPI00286EE6AD|nr:coagulation factor VII-like isoform X2 [Neocloeon triangulifer]